MGPVGASIIIIYNTPPWMTTHKEYASLKSCQEKNLVGKNQWRRKRNTVLLCFYKCLKIASLKPCKGKPCGKKTLAKEKEYNQHIIFWNTRESAINYYNGGSYWTHMFQRDSETLLKFAELFRPLAELFSSTCCNYFIHLQQMISDISI